MDTSIPEIEKNTFYTYLHNFTNGPFGFAILSIEGDILKGLEFSVDKRFMLTGKFELNKTEIFAMTKGVFQSLLLDTNEIEYVQHLPQFVVKEFKDIYNSLLDTRKAL